MVSTASDYVRFAQMLLNGGELDQVRLLSPRTVSFMTSDHLWPGVAFSPVTLNLFEPLGIAPTPKVGQGFGLGFVVRTQEGRNPMPGSPGEYFWAGIWGTAFWVDPKEKLITVLMMQAAPLQARYYRSLIRNLTSQALIDRWPAAPSCVGGRASGTADDDWIDREADHCSASLGRSEQAAPEHPRDWHCGCDRHRRHCPGPEGFSIGS